MCGIKKPTHIYTTYVCVCMYYICVCVCVHCIFYMYILFYLFITRKSSCEDYLLILTVIVTNEVLHLMRSLFRMIKSEKLQKSSV